MRQGNFAWRQSGYQTLREVGNSIGEIANKVGCSKSAAYKVFKNFQQTGNLAVRKRTGRSKILSERDERDLRNSARKKCFSHLRSLCGSFKNVNIKENSS